MKGKNGKAERDHSTDCAKKEGKKAGPFHRWGEKGYTEEKEEFCGFGGKGPEAISPIVEGRNTWSSGVV